MNLGVDHERKATGERLNLLLVGADGKSNETIGGRFHLSGISRPARLGRECCSSLAHFLIYYILGIFSLQKGIDRFPTRIGSFPRFTSSQAASAHF